MAGKVSGPGSGQGKVRHFRNGIMVRCANDPCHRMMMYYDPLKKTTNMNPPWKCEPCTRGQDAFVPKSVRVGQQKQKK